jgi:DNA mismatch repair protein MutS2
VSCGEPALRSLAEAVPELRQLVRDIFSIVDRDGQLREGQIPELKEIRERLRGLARETERVAQAYLSNPAYRSYWHAELPSQKNGRTVLPVKKDFKGRIPGIVHDVSSSGATLYLEPLELVEKNNAVAELQNRYRREVHRILREASRPATPCWDRPACRSRSRPATATAC